MNSPHDPSPARDATRGRPGAHDAPPIGEEARTLASHAATAGRDKLDGVRQDAASTVDRLAESVDAAAEQLQDGDDPGHLSSHIGDLAGAMHAVAKGLKEKSPDALLQDVNRVARENPALFLAGAAVVGFAVTRLLKVSADGASPGSSRSDRDGDAEKAEAGTNREGGHSTSGTSDRGAAAGKSDGGSGGAGTASAGGSGSAVTGSPAGFPSGVREQGASGVYGVSQTAPGASSGPATGASAGATGPVEGGASAPVGGYGDGGAPRGTSGSSGSLT